MIAYRVQHHPARARTLERLIASAPDIPWLTVTDPNPTGKPSAWRTYRSCIESVDDEEYVLIAQDDAVCVPGFREAVERALEAKPQTIISFFHGTFPRTTRRFVQAAMQAKEAFWEVPRGRWIPTVCLLWPTEQARDLLAWAVEDGVPVDFRGDDSVLGRWSRERRQSAYVTTLSLVEHPDDVPSQVATKVSGRRHAQLLAQDGAQWIALLTT